MAHTKYDKYIPNFLVGDLNSMSKNQVQSVLCECVGVWVCSAVYQAPRACLPVAKHGHCTGARDTPLSFLERPAFVT